VNKKEQRFVEQLEDRKGVLYFDGVSAPELAKKFDTPLYVISENRIRENYERLYKALSCNYGKIGIYYAAKANSNLSVLKVLENEGAHLDAVSPGEVSLAFNAGFGSERILFTGTSVRNDELKFLADSNVKVNVDSLSEIDRLLKITVPNILSVRINPEIGAGHHDHCITAGKDTKFGLWEHDALKAYEKAKNAGVERFGIHMHIGSGILEIEPFVLALDKLLSIAKKLHDKFGICLEFVNMGGGLGVPYKPQDEELDLSLLSMKLLSLFKSRIDEYDLGKPFFCVEPGRYLVCDAGILLTTVNTVKVTPFKRFVGVDAGFNTLLRPTMYGSYHQVLVANRIGAPNEATYDVVGPICESGDVLAKDRRLPKIQEGDLLTILNAGAYGYVMSSQYNSRPRAAEVLVKDGKYGLVREREHLDDLVRGERTAW
jgi:diaminopimelate decarboxylase